MSKNGVEGKQEHVSCKKYTLQLNPHYQSKNTNGPSPQQFLNGQGVPRISELGIRVGSKNIRNI